ncbi:TRM1 [Candida oxycetoniae]|uniref:tRNA (guanine(26)-N(2))-dimethyltransferase n=1 Tax=Candida oxycetoniae TaxID=497107 RepID=A0AAI9WX71_9ASCO|nr:TRM1 [Candida oxycetoniae]KAI3404006.2 TRM1 [Candida oxycetoniae]
MYKRIASLFRRSKMASVESNGDKSQLVTESAFNYTTEGKATILTPQKDEVFYNPIQQFNRDLSAMSIIAYNQLRLQEAKSKNNKKRKLQGLTILEALAASGLRSCRYGLEISQVHKIVANDLSSEAVESINRNIEHNGLTGKVQSNQSDAIKFMSSTNMKFHIIDLDPYGTASPFIDSAIQCLEDEGMLLVTCTDAAVLAGSGYPEKCFALYGGNNFGSSYINSETNHEVGIRLMLQLIANTAAKYKKAIEPMLSLSIDYYFRVWVKVKTSPVRVKNISSETMLAFGCNGCGNKVVQPLGIKKECKFSYPKLQQSVSSHCPYCNGSFNIAGPMYGGEIHNPEFLDQILAINEKSDKEIYKTTERIKGMLTLAKNELTGVPFFFNLNQLSALFKSPPISIDSYSRAIGNLGYNLSLTHAKKNCIKTDAPWSVNLEVIKQWSRETNEAYLKEMKEKQANGEELNDKIKDKMAKLDQDINFNPNLSPKSPGANILMKTKELELDEERKSLNIDFTTENEVSKKISKLRKLKMVRYQENPRKNWGPMSRPK